MNDFIILEFSGNFAFCGVFGVVWGVFGEYWRSRDRLINMKYLQCEVFGGLEVLVEI